MVQQGGCQAVMTRAFIQAHATFEGAGFFLTFLLLSLYLRDLSPERILCTDDNSPGEELVGSLGLSFQEAKADAGQ